MRPGIVFYWIIASCLLGFVFRRDWERHPIEQNLDHPSRWGRYFYRYCLFWYCFLLSFFISPLVLVHLSFLSELREANEWVRTSIFVAWFLPLAIALYWMVIRFKRRSAARRGESVGPPLVAAPIPIAAPIRIAIDDDTRQLDPGDDEAVRALARKHWGAIQAAIEGRGDINEANIASTAVFDLYVPSLPPDVGRRVRDIYMAECDLQAGLGLVQMELAAALQRDAAKIAAESRRRKRNTTIIGSLLLVLAIAAIVVVVARH